DTLPWCPSHDVMRLSALVEIITPLDPAQRRSTSAACLPRRVTTRGVVSRRSCRSFMDEVFLTLRPLSCSWPLFVDRRKATRYDIPMAIPAAGAMIYLTIVVMLFNMCLSICCDRKTKSCVHAFSG